MFTIALLDCHNICLLIFVLQATCRTKVGSSGSPVIDWQGRAVALHAGSNVSSTLSYFLPLEQVSS
jgi:hypothetical protein